MQWLVKKLSWLVVLVLLHAIRMIEKLTHSEQIVHELSDHLDNIMLYGLNWSKELLPMFQKMDTDLELIFAEYCLVICIHQKPVSWTIQEKLDRTLTNIGGLHYESGVSRAGDDGMQCIEIDIYVDHDNSNNAVIHTCYHEIGHAIYRIFGLQECWQASAHGLERLGHAWKERSSPNPGLVSVYSSKNPEEAFCELFATFCINECTEQTELVYKNLAIIETIITDIQSERLLPRDDQYFHVVTLDDLITE